MVNPSYTVFIAHRDPTKCPLGAFAMYFHWLYDQKELLHVLDIDWEKSTSWRGIFLLHGPSFPDTAFNQQSLYNLYAKAFDVAGFESRVKAHLPRHLLGYDQAKMNVEASETSKMGWERGQTYADVYSAALPKNAILAQAGFWNDEAYDPVHTCIIVPIQFLALVCPMAEKYLAQVNGKHVCSFAIVHFSDRISSRLLVRMDRLENVIERRTAQFSPSKGFSVASYNQQVAGNASHRASTSPIILHVDTNNSPTGTYKHADGLRAFASPPSVDAPRPTTQVDYVLPPITAFYKSDSLIGFMPPFMGQKAITWSMVFLAIKQPSYCWKAWAPSKTIGQFEDVAEVWRVWTEGEPRTDANGVQTGMRPPLRLVEETFGHCWRTGNQIGSKTERTTARKRWEHFREIPEWIATESERCAVAPAVIIQELEELRERSEGAQRINLSTLTDEVKAKRELRQKASVATIVLVPPSPPMPAVPVCDATIGAVEVIVAPLQPAIALLSADVEGIPQKPTRKRRAKPIAVRRPSKKQKEV
ncbi:unnamed protein product [Mycena citricolor]|uniref:Uncharacterized protein n=1 Tax=Mycena citricolor TaxID=2018698 RepID=A0AAD2HAX0_9AGAR|nr:unnamed protein product [Mycena citricolor]